MADQARTSGRSHWAKNVEFVLASMGNSVGLGNAWRFPYRAYENGGAAFVLIYILLQFLIGKPMYTLEVTLGQYSSKGPTGVWDICPCFRGIGMAMVIISVNISVYYNVIMSYITFFLFASMTSSLPWDHCQEDWTLCTESKLPLCNDTTVSKFSCRCNSNFTPAGCVSESSMLTPTQYYFTYKVTEEVNSLDLPEFGAPLPTLVGCLAFCWMVVALCLIWGLKSTGKVVYATATLPYLFLLILLIAAFQQEGYLDGIKFFIVPDWSKFGILSTWAAAGGQMFFSLSLTMGSIITFGSYNDFRTNAVRNSIFIAMMDMCTSFIAGFAIFGILGALAFKKGVAVTDVAKGGFDLAFIIYPEAVGYLPAAPFFSVVFFAMFFFLGLDSEFALVETILTVMEDEWPILRRYRPHCAVSWCFGLFLLGLPLVCPGGKHLLNIYDTYGGDISLLFVGVFEIITVGWIYGAQRFLRDIEFMLGYKLRTFYYWVASYVFFSPVGIMALLLLRLINYELPNFPNNLPYPVWATALGFLVLFATVFPIFLWFFYSFFKASGGFLQRLKQITDPKDWKPVDPENQPMPPPPANVA